MRHPIALILGCLLASISLAGLRAQESPRDYLTTFDDFPTHGPVDRLDISGIGFPGGAIVLEGVPTDTPFKHLARRDWTQASADKDPEPLVITFDKAQALVEFAVGNPTGAKGLLIHVRAYDGVDATKPVITLTMDPGAKPEVQTRVRLCRLLEADLRRVEIQFSGDRVEVLDSLFIRRGSGGMNQIGFDDVEPGSVIRDRYPGIRFPDGPVVVTEEALGVPVRSPSHALRQTTGAEADIRPLVMTFQPAQGAVRLHVGYPASEQNGGTLRVVMRVFGGTPKSPELVVEQEAILESVTAIRVPLAACRPELDIHRVEVWFDRAFGGYEVIDDLEFGPVPVQAGPDDETPPEVFIDTPADGTVVPQPSPEPAHRTTTVRVTGRIAERQGLASATLEVIPADGSAGLRDTGFLQHLTGATSPYRFDVPVLLTYGTNLIRITATDASGNTTISESAVYYLGPGPVSGLGAVPEIVRPQRVFRDASVTGSFIGSPEPIVDLATMNFHAHCRVYLIPESVSTIPPAAPFLIDTEILSRDPSGRSVQVRVPESVFARPGRYVWLIWDLWSRPGVPAWIRAGVADVRAWSYPALWSMGFRNRDETNSISEFEAVFGNDIAPGFLETTSDLGGCSRGTSAVSYFLDTFDPGMNDDPGSCYGYAAMTQLFASRVRRPEEFDPAVHHPSAFNRVDPMVFNEAGCTPATPANLWATIQTAYGVQFSFEDLRDWSDQVEWDENRWVGNPVARANELRGNESGYTIALIPEGMSSGHVVAPYRVEDLNADTVRIWVVDSNFPYDITQPEEALVNRLALNRFVDIDRRSNTYRFSVGASDDPSREYQGGTNIFRGQGLSLTRIGVFVEPRTIPGLNLWWHQTFGVTGDALPEMTIPEKGRFGWDSAGVFSSTLSGIRPFTGFSYAGEPVVPRLILVPTNHTEVRFKAQATGPEYRFHTAAGGVTFSLHRRDAVSGVGDEFVVRSRNGVQQALTYKAASDTASLVPTVIATDGKSFETAVEWIGLRLLAHEPISLAVEPSGRALTFRNDSSRTLHFGAALRDARAGSVAIRRYYGPFELESGAQLELLLSSKPGDDILVASVDQDLDGKMEFTQSVVGVAIHVAPGSSQDCNNNGVLDSYEILNGDVPDANRDGRPDSCPVLPPACPPGGTLDVRFDSLPDGPVATQVDTITALSRAGRIRGGILEPVTEENASSDPAGMGFQFACSRDYVRLELSAETAPKRGAMATLMAYSNRDATKPVAIARRLIPGPGDTNRWIEVRTALDRDIDRVELVYPDDVVESIVRLEHGTWPTHAVTRIDFEAFAPATPIEFQYPGLRVMDSAVIIAETTLGTGVSSGTQALRRQTDTVFDPQPLRFRLQPAQMGVRMNVGFPASEDIRSPLRVILRGFGSKNNLVGAVTNRILTPSAIRRPIGLETSGEDRITWFTLEYVTETSDLTYVHSGFEVLDDLEFGPFPPSTAQDRTPPVITLDSPVEGREILANPAASSRIVGLQGRIREANGIESLTATIVDLDAGTTNEVPFLETALNGLAPNYNFNRPIELGLGRRLVTVVATDLAGNEARAAVTVETAPYPPSRLLSAPSLVAHEHTLREPEFHSWDTDRPRLLEGLEEGLGSASSLGFHDGLRIRGGVSVFRGENFHQRLLLYLVPTNNVTQVDPSGWRQENNVPLFIRVSPDGTRLETDVPLSVTSMLGSRWRWLLRDPIARPGAVEWIDGGPVKVAPEHTRLNGFPFRNTDDTVGLGMFDTSFGNSVYLPTPFCSIRDPLALITYPIYKIWMDNTVGSCVGISATSQLILSGAVDPAGFVPGVHSAGELYPRRLLPSSRFPLPEQHNNPDCGPRTPANLWALIRGMQGVQTSSEFIAAWGAVAQSDGFFSIGGNPREVLRRVRENPANYVICMVPAVGRGHAVVPYEVVEVDGNRTRIRVYDPNFPALELNSTNVWNRTVAANQYIEINRAENTYSFYLSGRFNWQDRGEGDHWTGNGVYAIPLSVWRGQRHWILSISGLTQLAFFPFFLGTAGDARPHLVDEEREWGWRNDGTYVEKFPGLTIPSLVGAVDTLHSNALMVLDHMPRNPVLSMRSKGGSYHVATATASAVWDLAVMGGGNDRFEPHVGRGHVQGFDFTPESDDTRLLPSIGLTSDGTNRVVFRWMDLELPADGRVGLDVDTTNALTRLHNHSGRELRPRLLVESVPSGSGLHVFAFEPNAIPPGGSLGVRSMENGIPGQLEILEDANGDGVPERSAIVNPRRLAGPSDPGAQDANGNGAFDAVDIAAGRSQDTNANGIPDEVESMAVGPLLEVPTHNSQNGLIRLRIRSDSSSIVVLERSVDLTLWTSVAEGSPEGGTVVFDVEATGDRAFFRATLK